MSPGLLHRFLFEGLPVRGALVRLTGGWREVLARRAAVGAYPPPVRALLGEMLAAGVLMHSNIKFDGALVLQVHGDGPLKLAVAEITSELGFRATAQLAGPIGDSAALPELVNVHGRGRCAITLDARDRPTGTMPYQGIVPLHGDQGEPLHSIAEVLEHYMLQSEQLDTRLILASDDELAAGLLLQRMPVTGAGNLGERDEDRIGLDEDFNRIALLGGSLTREELLTLDVDTLLRRLFWQENVRVFEPRQARFRCACSRERVRAMLVGLGREEIEDIIAERGDVEVGCDFCGLHYYFDAVDVGEMFAPTQDQQPGPGTLQ
ncbi:MAG: Hsp33 family molecular chaperone HslO [Gammaproteobacteria bacterium]